MKAGGSLKFFALSFFFFHCSIIYFFFYSMGVQQSKHNKPVLDQTSPRNSQENWRHSTSLSNEESTTSLSDVSSTVLNSKKKKFTLGKKKKIAAAVYDSPSCASLPSSKLSFHSSNQHQPQEVTATFDCTAAKMTAIYNQEQATSYSSHSFSSSSMAKSPEKSLVYNNSNAQCLKENSNTTSNSGHDTMHQSFNDNDGTVPIPPSELFSPSVPLYPKKNQNNHVNDVPQPPKPITSQDIVLDLYLGANNGAERKKEKDRQQRLVREPHV